MFKNLLQMMIRYFYKGISEIPPEHLQEFDDEILSINLRREQFLLPLLLLADLILLITDITYFYRKWDVIPFYKNLFFAHAIFGSMIILQLYIMARIANMDSSKATRIKKCIHLGITIFTLFWCEFLSINAQLIHGQISAYIICVFCIASVAILKPLESTIIFISSYITFIAAVTMLKQGDAALSGNIINSTFSIALACFASKMMFRYHVNNYIYRRTIEIKSAELKNLNANLEKLVDQRTEALKEANELLIKEMEIRHHAELEAASTRCIYEEKEKELDRTIELEKLRTTFFSNISHDLKTPLNVILSAGQLLDYKLKNYAAPDVYTQVNKHTYLIKQNCYRLIRLVSNLLDITKIDAGYFEISPKNCDIVKLVEDVTLSVVEYVESNNIELVFDTEVEEKTIACDADKIERVILNLLSNSAKFTPAGGSIFVNISIAEDRVIISVRDTGVGIPKEIQNKIFERFIQADDLLKKNSGGSGIGLSLVKAIVEMHKGQIILKSEPGFGSEFIIELPDVTIPDQNESIESNSLENDKRIESAHIEFSDIYL